MEIAFEAVASIVIASQTEWLHEEGDLISLCQINFPRIINTPPLHFNTSEIFWLRHLDILLRKLALMWKCVFNDWHTIKKNLHSTLLGDYILQLYWLRCILSIDKKVPLRHGIIFKYHDRDGLCSVFILLKPHIKIFISWVIHRFLCWA